MVLILSSDAKLIKISDVKKKREVTVTDDEISAAILALMEQHKLVTEGAGAVAVAAAMFGKVDIENKKTVCLLSGGNIDVSFIHRIIEIGLMARERKIKFYTTLSDTPGSLEKLARIIGGVKITDTTVMSAKDMLMQSYDFYYLFHLLFVYNYYNCLYLYLVGQ